MIIFGAGMAGCLAGIIFPEADIYESSNGECTHKAVLRFKTDSISKITGIPFKQVKVSKSIWFEGNEVKPSPRFDLMYSKKVTGKYTRRSISNIDTEVRWIAPEDFLDLMRQQLQTRITYESYIPDIFLNNDKLTKTKQPVISTLPISVNAGLCDYNAIFSGDKRGIYVNHYRVPCCDYYGTVYYPDPITSIYRASLTGDLLIIESILPLEGHEKELFDVSASFGIYDYKFTDHIINDHYQVLGKISPMDESIRRDLILKMTVNNNLYSLGRFATWRNILLDDVLQDIFKIKELVNKDLYDKVRII